MSKKEYLVIIESPAKARSLRGYLGDEYEIIASNGHVRDLPQNYLGVDMENGFRPTYTILQDKRKTVEQLKKKARSFHRIFLAADPDREGEAICWHLSQILERDGVKFNRLRFNAITKETVLASLKKPSMIDMQLVNAQQARRVMDRLVGYRISSWLQRLMGKGRSAGRVQSVALRMIQEREDEISDFKPVEYWVIKATFMQGDTEFQAFLQGIDGKPCCKPGKTPRTRLETDALISRMNEAGSKWRITGIASRIRSVKPQPPFITSTLQQAASNRLSYSPSRTMTLAQQLYEGVELGKGQRTGLITYMRTDSVRMSPESLASLREYLVSRFGHDSLTKKVRRYRSSKGSQDAHEAIRPVDPSLTPEKLQPFLNASQMALYRLIWNRFAATQLNDARIRTTKVTVSREGLEFTASGEEIVEKGFSVIDPQFVKISMPLPRLEKDDVEITSHDTEQKFTTPPSRYTEARLVSEMKKVGIGRPSTYVSTIQTLGRRRYVSKEGRFLKPTELGTTTVRILVQMFPHIFQVDFTARMEDLLDSVAKGENSYEDVLQQLSIPLEASLRDARNSTDRFREELEEDTGEKCPQCGSKLVIRWGKYGKFKACTAFPKCRFSQPLSEEGETSDSGRNCPECGGKLLIKSGRYGRYLGCENHPRCNHTQPLPTGVSCPMEGCQGELVEKRTRRGRTFYGCSRYPKCDFAMWNLPLQKTCPRCGFPVLERRKKGVWCPSCKKKIEN